MFSMARCSLINQGDCTGHAYSRRGLTSDLQSSEEISLFLLPAVCFSRPNICSSLFADTSKQIDQNKSLDMMTHRSL